jgi:hypothetical protein
MDRLKNNFGNGSHFGSCQTSWQGPTASFKPNTVQFSFNRDAERKWALFSLPNSSSIPPTFRPAERGAAIGHHSFMCLNKA